MQIRALMPSLCHTFKASRVWKINISGSPSVMGTRRNQHRNDFVKILSHSGSLSSLSDYVHFGTMLCVLFDWGPLRTRVSNRLVGNVFAP